VTAAFCLPHVINSGRIPSFGTLGLNRGYAVFSLVILAPWAFVGFEVTAFDTAHFKFPMNRTRSIIIVSIMIAALAYISMALISIAVVPDGFSSWQEYITELNSTESSLRGVVSLPTFFAAKTIMGTPGLVVMIVTAVAAILTGIIGGYRATTRVLSTMAEDRILSEKFSKTSYSILFKFTPEGGAVTASLMETGSAEHDYRSYEIRVQDTGIGMSKEFAERMFNAFERERTSTVSGVEGTGLGLSITKGIVDLMGGTIDVLTAPGSGTQIVIRLKFRPADEKDVDSVDRKEAEQLTNNDPAKQEIDFSKKRLLLVEDNEINMEIALMILSQAGFMVDTAENGQIAVDLVSSSVPGYYDAILMDIQMPVMNGFEATRTIRSLPDPSLARIPIIAMTANAFKEDAQATLDAGMEAHIAKPIDVDILMKTLTDVLLASEKK